ncbi:class I SAM-dependent methyltransferase [Nocardioides mesophilus]|uniref:Methyltransferase domain-containing protein n=1 Tax=Nocardioides mesophilus TaxID=433659 RepID=A0A7G9RC00_9ACTN|nr:class I SAM-dependent methyltransferase [Nocardioides mesophilus]QNN53125.1 methyltransferase domain-containing protein [Nocardioides mesophilus]
MSHPEQLGFFLAVADANPAIVRGGRVLEIGSYDVNGSIRSLFESAREYVGVDLDDGPGVDVVGFGHEIADADGSFDLTISGECFEHDPHWRATFANMSRLARPGGLVAFSCASRGRPEHGTRRTDETLSPGTQSVGLDYYRNLIEADFLEMPLAEWFSVWRFWYLPTHFDLYFAGIRRGGDLNAHLPDTSRVDRLAELMPRAHRLARLPLRGLAATAASEARFQTLIVPYWYTLLRLMPSSTR